MIPHNSWAFFSKSYFIAIHQIPGITQETQEFSYFNDKDLFYYKNKKLLQQLRVSRMTHLQNVTFYTRTSRSISYILQRSFSSYILKYDRTVISIFHKITIDVTRLNFTASKSWCKWMPTNINNTEWKLQYFPNNNYTC